MKIALFTETFVPEVNGVVTILRELLNLAKSAGHEVLVLGPQGAPASYANATIVRLKGLPLTAYQGCRITPPQPAIMRALREFQPDVIHAIGTLLLGPAAIAAGRRLDRPVITSYQSHFAIFLRHYRLGVFAPLVWRHLRRAHNQATLALCPSSDTQRMLIGQGFTRGAIWPGGVDTDRFHPRWRSLAWRRSHGIADDRPLVLSVGRLAAEKNLDVLATALARLKDAQVMIVGDGPQRAALQEQLGGHAHFTGYLHGADLATAYASADLFVFPSVTETFGQVTLEALASGLPVITTSVGAGADLVRPGRNGLLVPNDAGHLRAATQALIDAPAVRARMVAEARDTSLGYAWPLVIGQLFAHYHAALARHHTISQHASRDHAAVSH
jgi:phosphatidylinositol alpha 1,6-mannosyltransferase